MFGLGMPEILMILAIALIVIGPKKLPELAKTLGRALGEFKNAAQDFKKSMDVEPTVKKFNGPADSIKAELKDAVETAKVRGKRDFGDLAGTMADDGDDSMDSPDSDDTPDLNREAPGYKDFGKTDKGTGGNGAVSSEDGSAQDEKFSDNGLDNQKDEPPKEDTGSL